MKTMDKDRKLSTCRIYRLIVYFFIYSFIGWCIEVTYVSMIEGHFVNRGFLIGPFCCIYGFGALLTIIFLKRFKYNALLLFLSAATITTVLEYITGFFLERIFNNKWWDYSNQPFNIAGRVCLRNSLIWGAIAVIAIYFIHPFIRFAAIGFLKYSKPLMVYSILFYFIADFVLSALTVNNNLIGYTYKIKVLFQEVKSFINYMQDFTLKNLDNIRSGILCISKK